MEEYRWGVQEMRDELSKSRRPHFGLPELQPFLAWEREAGDQHILHEEPPGGRDGREHARSLDAPDPQDAARGEPRGRAPFLLQPRKDKEPVTDTKPGRENEMGLAVQEDPMLGGENQRPSIVHLPVRHLYEFQQGLRVVLVHILVRVAEVEGLAIETLERPEQRAGPQLPHEDLNSVPEPHPRRPWEARARTPTRRVWSRA